MAISETKMKIVIDNYFKTECDVNTSIRQAFEKGFRIGVLKGQSAERKTGKWIEIRRNDVNPITGKCGVYVGCSECGAPLPTDSMFDFIDESDCKFCYNCGAKMIGGDDDV